MASVRSKRDAASAKMRTAPSSAPLPAKLATLSSADWERAVGVSVLRRFKEAVKGVPAYRQFLAKAGCTPSSIKTRKDVDRIPPISKGNYLRVYPWDTLSRSGALGSESLVLTATSGSTGQPFYIPRTDEVHEASTVFHQLFLERSGLSRKKRTLVIVAFGMGVWIGGLLTYEAFRRASERDWPLTLITPGVNKKEIFEALTRIGPSYEQLVLCGYPPFVKDLVDGAVDHGVDWRRWDMRIVCAAEAFSEQFRDYLMEKTGMQDPYRSVMNIYGSAELGTMASETPLTVLLRRLALSHEALYRKLFREANRLPTLAQFIPDLTAFEQGKEGQVYATGGSVLPFIRYDIGDQGGVCSYEDAERACADLGIDLAGEAERTGIADTIRPLPLVYIYERTDLSTKLYGAIIFPEHVKLGLAAPALERYVTGRFTMTTEHDASHNEYLELNIELKHGIADGEPVRQTIIESVMQSLAASSDEYRYLMGSVRDKVVPRVVFWPHEDPKYFAPGVKQKWVIRS